MSVTPGEAGVVALLAAIRDPAVIVDAAGTAIGWNPAARALLDAGDDVAERHADPLAILGPEAAQRLPLADPPGGTLLVWPRDDAGRPDASVIGLEKLSVIERIAGGVRHDLMNPLGAVMGFAELQHTDPRLPDDVLRSSKEIADAARRVQHLIDTMLQFSRGAPAGNKRIALGPLVRDLAELMSHFTMDMHPRVDVAYDLPEIEAHPGQIAQALLAVLVHAIETQGETWTRGGQPVRGRLTVSARAVDDVLGNRVRVTVEDGGPVVAPEARGALFETAEGDLAVARALVEQAGGRVSYEPLADGNRIVVELPVAGTTLPALSEAEPVVADGPPLVLVCDADPIIRGLLVRYVTGSGARAIEARDGEEAIAAMADKPVVLVVADLHVDAGGATLYDRAVALRPRLARHFVLVSGDPGNAALAQFTERTGVSVLAKPFDKERIAQLVRDAAEG